MTMLNTADPDYSDYVALRHLHPEMVRTLRLGLSNRCKPEGLRRKFKKERIAQAGDAENIRLLDIAEGALRFMVRNPEAGVIRWTEGEQYVFVETETA